MIQSADWQACVYGLIQSGLTPEFWVQGKTWDILIDSSPVNSEMTTESR